MRRQQAQEENENRELRMLYGSQGIQYNSGRHFVNTIAQPIPLNSEHRSNNGNHSEDEDGRLPSKRQRLETDISPSQGR